MGTGEMHGRTIITLRCSPTDPLSLLISGMAWQCSQQVKVQREKSPELSRGENRIQTQRTMRKWSPQRRVVEKHGIM